MSQVFSIEPIVMMNNFGFKTQTQFLDILGDNSRVVVIIFLDIVPRLLLVLAQVMYGGDNTGKFDLVHVQSVIDLFAKQLNNTLNLN